MNVFKAIITVSLVSVGVHAQEVLPVKTVDPAVTVVPATATQAPVMATQAPPAQPPQVTVPAVQPSDSEDDWRFGLGVSYNQTAEAKFKEVGGTIGAIAYGGGNAEIGIEEAFAIEAEFRKVPKHQLGLIFGVALEQERNLQSGYSDLGGYMGLHSELTIQTTILSASAAYRWNTVYVPFGINYSVYKVKSEPSLTAYKVNSGLGIHVGIGNYITKYVVFECQYRIQSANYYEWTPGTPDTSIYMEDSFIKSFAFAAKYIF